MIIKSRIQLAPLIVFGALVYSLAPPQASAEFLHPHGGACCPIITPPRPDPLMATSASAVSNPVVRIGYIIPSNRVAGTGAVERIQWVMTMVQDWYRDQLARYGYGPRTFRMETMPDGVTPMVHVVQSGQLDTYFHPDVWGRTIEQATAGGLPIWTAGQVWLLISEAHVQAANGAIAGTAALGASFGSGDDPGVAMMGGDALARYRPEFLTNSQVYAGTTFAEIGPHPMVSGVTFPSFEGSTWSEVSSSVIGALAHELGHAFGLPHDFRNDENFRGNLMGNGSRGIRGNFYPSRYTNNATTINAAMARALSVSRYFGNNTADTTRPSVTVTTTGNVMPAQGLVSIEFQASDDQQLAAAWLEWNYDAVTDMALQGTSTSVIIRTSHFNAGQTNVYKINVWDHAGNRQDIVTNIVVMTGSSAAPKSKLVVNNITGFAGRSISLSASGSTISQNGPGVTYTFHVNGPENLVIGPQSNPSTVITLNEPGFYQAHVSIVDQSGFTKASMPVAILNHQPVLYSAKPGDDPGVIEDAYGVSASSVYSASAAFTPLSAPSTRAGFTINPLSGGIVLDRAESWTNGTLEGWRCSQNLGFFTYNRDAQLSVISNSLAVSFPANVSEFPPPFYALNVVALTSSSGGRLTGNIAASGATHLVFDLFADGPLTNDNLTVRLRRQDYSNEGTLFSYTATATAGWNRVYVPLNASSMELYSYFVGKPGFTPPYDDEFQATLENLTHLMITLSRSDNGVVAPAEQHLINNVRWTDASASLSASSASHGSGPVNNGVIEIITTAEWSATTTADWITLTTVSGTGQGFATYSVAPNVTSAERTATITITVFDQNLTFIVTQSGESQVDYVLAWPTAVGFVYELQSMYNLTQSWSAANRLITYDGHGGVVEQGLKLYQQETYFRLGTFMK